MNGKVKCTCGWSWNKSDSSKKDMYICHECGRDNSNNMKNGGWLDSYADGGTMQEHQENYNDSSVLLPEGYVGEGYNTKGRNYSPAWGGQFEDGGLIPIAQNGRATAADSLDIYNRSLKIDAYYNNLKKKGWYPKREIYPTRRLTSKDLELEMKAVDNESRETYKKQSKESKKYSRLRNMYPNVDPKKANLNALAEHIKLTRGTKYASKDNLPSIIDPMAPTTVIDTRIIPKERVYYETIEGVKTDQFFNKYPNATDKQLEKHAQEMLKLGHLMPPSGSAVNLYRYDPLSVKPWNMLTDAEKKLRVQKYGTDGVPKSYIKGTKDKLNKDPKPNPNKKLDADPKIRLQPDLPMVEAVNLPPMQQLQSINPPAISDSIRAPKSYDVSTQRYNMQGPNDYYKANEEEIDYERAMQIKAASDAFNKDIEKRYGPQNEYRTPKSAEKAAERLKQLRSEFTMTPNYQMGGSVYPVNYVPEAQMGASIPGVVGFSYARTINPAPDNGPGAKKTMASAKDGNVIKDDRGQWDHPGEITRISGGNITMKKDPRTGKALTEPLLGIADTGEQQWMYPGEDYNFEGANYVTEIPKRKLAKNGIRQEQKGLVNLDNLLNFTNYNTKQPGGWLESYK